jgi:hypothetical protein
VRTNLFTFKKTKRIKMVTEYPAITVDLTKEEVLELAKVIHRSNATSIPSDPWRAIVELYGKLCEFSGYRP